MKRLNRDLKRMLTGLVFQDVTDFSPMNEKIQLLALGPQAGQRRPAQQPRRIALLCDGSDQGAAVGYTIDAGLRQAAQIDLLIHGAADTERMSALENQVRAAGLVCRGIRLERDAVISFDAYLNHQLSLIFVVAMPDDSVARILIEEVLPRRRRRIPVPLVLISEQPATRARNQSAA